jgi:hypothetical protein
MQSKTILSLYALIIFFMTAPAYAAACNVNCLTVYSNTLRDLGTSIAGTVKLVDETGGC